MASAGEGSAGGLARAPVDSPGDDEGAVCCQVEGCANQLPTAAYYRVGCVASVANLLWAEPDGRTSSRPGALPRLLRCL